MPAPFTSFGPIYTTTYSLLMGMGIIASLSLSVWMYRRRYAEPAGRVADVLIAGLISGVLLARVGHVLLNWDYFSIARDEIRFIAAGGLDWHGAVIGAVLAMALAAKVRRVRLHVIFDTLALTLPVLAFLAWWGCGANHCAYGGEVDNPSHYPAWLVWERHDIYNIILPRYATQPLGMAFSLGLFAFTLVMWDRLPSGGRLWVVLLLLAAGMFVLGFIRGDHALIVAGLRQDQWLDVCLMLVGAGCIVYT